MTCARCSCRELTRTSSVRRRRIRLPPSTASAALCRSRAQPSKVLLLLHALSRRSRSRQIAAQDSRGRGRRDVDDASFVRARTAPCYSLLCRRSLYSLRSTSPTVCHVVGTPQTRTVKQQSTDAQSPTDYSINDGRLAQCTQSCRAFVIHGLPNRLCCGGSFAKYS